MRGCYAISLGLSHNENVLQPFSYVVKKNCNIPDTSFVYALLICHIVCLISLRILQMMINCTCLIQME